MDIYYIIENIRSLRYFLFVLSKFPSASNTLVQVRKYVICADQSRHVFKYSLVLILICIPS